MVLVCARFLFVRLLLDPALPSVVTVLSKFTIPQLQMPHHDPTAFYNNIFASLETLSSIVLLYS